MTEPRKERRHFLKVRKKLAPTGSVDEVLFTGSTGGRNLTLFQSVGLIITGLAVALGVGVAQIANEFYHEPRLSRSYGQLFGGVAFLLWGMAMVVFGTLGIMRLAGKRKRL